MKLLLAGPGTGKTTRIKSIIDTDYSHCGSILVLSFTNATVDDLFVDFSEYQNVSCSTLHSYALGINHLPNVHIIHGKTERKALERYANRTEIEFERFCDLIDCITFDQMITRCVAFIRANPVYAKDNIGKLDLLIVDEYQDFNEAERSLIELLQEFATETIILGDDDQSIYGFKDADPDGIISLYRSEGAEHIQHENTCYRCPDEVVKYANSLIDLNNNRIDKALIPCGKDGAIIQRQSLTRTDNDDFILATFGQIPENESILVLSPVSFFMDDLRKRLEERNIEYVDFWTPPINEETLKRIWWLKAIFTSSKLVHLLYLGVSHLTKPRYVRILKEGLGEGGSGALLQEALINSGYFDQSFISYIIDTPTIPQFVERHPELASLLQDIDEDAIEKSIQNIETRLFPNPKFSPDSVNLMSIHKSKGLQADHVFLTEMNDGVIPNDTYGEDTLEAQRRLFYVGISRAKKALYVLSTIEWEGKFVHRVDKTKFEYRYKKKRYHAKMTRFIEEIHET